MITGIRGDYGGWVTVERTVRVHVPREAYVLAYGPDPYDDGRSVDESIEVDVEAWLEDLSELAPADISIHTEVIG